jgi:hypothetical protein
MNNKMKKRRALAVVVFALVGAAGCELIVDFDRSKIDAGPITNDATFSDVPGSDSAGMDSAGMDSAGMDSSGQDTSVADTSVADTNVPDSSDSASAADTADE